MSPIRVARAFVLGMARSLDLGAGLHGRQKHGPQADVKALASDWAAVGNDLRSAMQNVETLCVPSSSGCAAPR